MKGYPKAIPPATLMWKNRYSSELWSVAIIAESTAIPGASYFIHEAGGSLLVGVGWRPNTRLVMNYPIWTTDNGPQFKEIERPLPCSVFEFTNMAEEHEAMLLAAQGKWLPIDTWNIDPPEGKERDE